MKNQKGQAVLIILLGMVVSLTVVLSIISSTTSDIKLGSTSTASLRAFSAAESGIEKTLIALSPQSGTVNSGANYKADVSGLAEGKTFFNYPSNLVTGDSGVLWFVAHGSDGSLVCDVNHPCFTGNSINICWSKLPTDQHTATTPAVEISVFYLSNPGDYSTAKVAKAIFDPNDTRRDGSNPNSYDGDDPSGNCTLGSTEYEFHKKIDFSNYSVPASSYGSQNGLQFMTVRMLYNTDFSQPLGFDAAYAGNSLLPSQGNVINSTGTLNEATRRIEVSRAYNPAPPVFDAAIFSPGGLSQ